MPFFIPSEKVVPRKIRDKRIIVPIADGVADFSDAMFSLNSTGDRIWECIEEKMSLGEICSTLVQEYDAPAKTDRAGRSKPDSHPA